MKVDHSDEHIKTLIHSGDQKGIELLFEKYFSIISKTAFYILNDDDSAQDIAEIPPLLSYNPWKQIPAIFMINLISKKLILKTRLLSPFF